jgi:hypothetical protein
VADLAKTDLVNVGGVAGSLGGDAKQGGVTPLDETNHGSGTLVNADHNSGQNYPLPPKFFDHH